MKANPSERFWKFAGIPLIILVVGACFCVSVLINGFAGLGDRISAPLRWLRGQANDEPQLYQVLRDRQEASFQLDSNCTFTYAQGSLVQSTPGEGGELARNLDRQEVINAALAALEQLSFYTSEGKLYLEPDIPVQTSALAGEGLSLSVNLETPLQDGASSTSLSGVVSGDSFSGTYYRIDSLSTVTNGLGHESARTLQAEFNCLIVWVDD